jgi:PAS domain S-box-containing protein
MNNKKTPSLNQTFFIVIAGTVFVAMALVGYIWISQEYNRFNKDSIALKSEYIKAQKLMLKNEVERAVDLIQYEKSQTEDRLKQNISNRVHEAHTIAMNIYLQNKETHSDKEISNMIKDALGPIRFNQGRGYFFAADFNGFNQFTDRPELIGTNLIDTKDSDGKFVVKDMIALVREKKEGFYRYTWTKPNAKGRGFPKIAYIKYFEPFNWFIGTGEYIDDVELDIKREVLERVSIIRFDNYKGYIFAGQWNGLSLLEPGKGKNMWNVEDVNGVKIVQEIIKTAKSDGGYVEYVLPKFKGYRSTLKISYTKGIKDWQWYVGAGKFMDEIDATIEQKRIMMNKNVNRKIVEIIFILLGVLILMILVTRFISRKIRDNFQVFDEFFRRAVSSSTYVEATKLNFLEFTSLAESANDMVDLRNKAEESLRRWHHIFQNAKWGIAIGTAGESTLDLMNPEFARMHGYSVEELTGQPVSSVFPSEEHTNIRYYAKTAEEKGHCTFESLHIRKDGSSFPTNNDITGVKDDTGKALYRVVNIQDISERKKADESLQKAHDELEEKVLERTSQLRQEIDERKQIEYFLLEARKEAEFANSAKSEFLSNVSHEFRTPMHQILSYSRFGVDKIDKVGKEKLLHYFSKIGTIGKNLLSLLNDLLDLSKLESGKLDYNMRNRNLQQIINKVTQEFVSLVDEKGLALEVAKNSLSTNIVCDEHKIGQVVRNCISNAVKFTPNDKKIFISIEQSQLRQINNEAVPALLVNVSDQGVGIPDEELDSVFDKFVQSSKTKTGSGGTGLGLAISKEIINAHNGKIWAENNPDGGATFSFMLPYEQEMK